MNEFGEAGPVLVISPHLDDAVLSCGQLIGSRPGTTIATILAGYPAGTHEGWSARTTGLPVAKDANQVRREEDERATRALGAETVWVDIPAQEYAPVNSSSERLKRIQEAIVATVNAAEDRSLFVPLGVTHADHIIVSNAALDAVLASRAEAYLYMDMPYGQARPGHVRKRLRHIRRTFRVEALAPFVGDLEAKAEAVGAYSSQVKALQEGFGRSFNRLLVDPEKYWRIRSSG